ncbi:MAG: nucleoside triphosphate pyrophosphohydrolase [Proteobacteria bacterium]|uniref:nucleoside triphosphate pyrophosphohydrolase n=1 Tax=Rudaea sp. TaxID=2136325 RepID=UPI001D27472D|nr:nucleoside triphosphate pyrophosphohydrolase [Pseudomonadota bacterium]MBS0566955.1 nucleoside triphosphate pyrophosphohydrolase [Pseudomonadota bacterium]
MANTIDDLLRIMATLRDPVRGCPWDVKQDFASIAPYTIEEAYEVADAIDRKDHADLRDELGDLLLQVVFHARMAEEQGLFAFADVVAAICDKMIRRHPHVFPDADGNLRGIEDADAQTAAWEELKRRERAGKGDADMSVLAGISRGLPEWQRAYKLQKRAATIGFDWSDPAPVLDKLEEEIGEVRGELAAAARIGADDAAAHAANHVRLADEIGDVLFVAVNLARLAKVDYSQALRGANAKFERRFRRMEALAQAEGARLDGKSLAEQDAYWNRAKTEDKAGLL